ncbi:hypothetical protein ON010_g58 [Phytophthora cinnamomi]|nr:hypothetical protein ON010_g58 [Phytophthora cinnamomi]
MSPTSQEEPGGTKLLTSKPMSRPTGKTAGTSTPANQTSQPGKFGFERCLKRKRRREEFISRDKKAFQLLINSLDDATVKAMGKYAYSWSVYEQMERVYASKDTVSIYHARSSFHNLKFKDGDDMQSHINALEEKAETLSRLGRPIDDEEEVTCLGPYHLHEKNLVMVRIMKARHDLERGINAQTPVATTAAFNTIKDEGEEPLDNYDVLAIAVHCTSCCLPQGPHEDEVSGEHVQQAWPIEVPTFSGKRYVLVFVDDFSDFTTRLLTHKSEALAQFREYVVAAETKHNCPVQQVNTDNGGEFISPEWTEYYKSKGIHCRGTTTQTPEQNGSAEARFRVQFRKVRALFIGAQLPKQFWGEALFTATLLNNVSPLRRANVTPYERWHRKEARERGREAGGAVDLRQRCLRHEQGYQDLRVPRSWRALTSAWTPGIPRADMLAFIGHVYDS